MRYFNIAGPVAPEEHYCIPPLDRVDLNEILALVRRKMYFLLHAPRQTGKTSTLQALADHLNASGAYRCVCVNVQSAQNAGRDLGRVVRVILAAVAAAARRTFGTDSLQDLCDRVAGQCPPELALAEFLELWCASESQPLVLLLDEIDALQDRPLLAVMDQLRTGHPLRSRRFPQSVVLCGQHNVRDYRLRALRSDSRRARASPFNIVAKSLRLGDFSPEDVRALLAQHTAETGQEFEPAAAGRVWSLTRGQPWLVNALCYQACFESAAGRDRSRPVRADAVEAAKEALILNRVTHLDQLAAKLSERPVRRVIEPMLEGSIEPSFSQEDLDYVRDLGLIARDDPVRIANPIYRDMVPRQITAALQSRLSSMIGATSYRTDAGGLDLPALMDGFRDFFRQHSEHWKELFGYREAGPLLLQAFLQRVVNSGGRVERDYGVGRRRTDLLIEWPLRGGAARRYVIECKVLRPGRGFETVVAEAVSQAEAYRDGCGAESGHVAVFDLRPGRTWEERRFRRDPDAGGPPITVWGL